MIDKEISRRRMLKKLALVTGGVVALGAGIFTLNNFGDSEIQFGRHTLSPGFEVVVGKFIKIRC
tara:strand:- start:820 stop:1011 length:192 start_codon:yes stop_codon:yes gene_type:complete